MRTEAWRHEVICPKAELEVTERELQPKGVWHSSLGSSWWDPAVTLSTHNSVMFWMFHSLPRCLTLYHVPICLQMFSSDVDAAQECQLVAGSFKVYKWFSILWEVCPMEEENPWEQEKREGWFPLHVLRKTPGLGAWKRGLHAPSSLRKSHYFYREHWFF